MSDREAKARRKMAKKYSESVDDSYDESSRTASDEEAHRNVVYRLPSKFTQIKECFMIQMKRYTRQKAMWFAVVLLILIPLVFLLFENVESMRSMLPDSDVTNIYIASILMLMPIVVPLLCSMACGSMLSQEFNERTVYLSLPLPMNRSAFFIGKFLAGFVLVTGVVTAAYGVSMVLAMPYTDKTYTREIFYSMLAAIAYTFFACAITYMMSTKLRRGSTMLPLILLMVVMPITAIALAQFVDASIVQTIASYFPTNGADYALMVLGEGAPLSVIGLSKVLVPSNVLNFTMGKSFVAMMAVPIILGLLMLIIGKKVIDRRDM